jgi:hypothetical protein
VNKPSIGIFSDRPDLITDFHNNWQISIQDPVRKLATETFGSDNHQVFLRYVARTHDRRLHSEFEYCLFCYEPVSLDLSEFLPYIGSDFTSYIDINQHFIFYRRDKTWRDKIIIIEKKPVPVGIIFIDCWQNILDDQWPDFDDNFNFYHNMTVVLKKYQASRLIFCTGSYGSLPLAQELNHWHSQSLAMDLQNINIFQQHYQKINVKNWIVVGAHWQRCTHDKPLGFHNLLLLKQQDPELRIYSHMDCTVKFLNDALDHPVVTTCSESDYQQDSLNWKITGRLAELIGPL